MNSINQIKKINQKIIEQIPNIKNVKYKHANHYDDPSYLQIIRKDNAKYHVIYNISYSETDTELELLHKNVLHKIEEIEKVINEVIDTIKNLNKKSKIKFTGDSINTGYLGNRYQFSFEVNGENKVKEYYYRNNFVSSFIISEISSFYVEKLEGVITYKNKTFMIDGVSVEQFISNNNNKLCKILIEK
jgi:hypothetical protein